MCDKLFSVVLLLGHNVPIDDEGKIPFSFAEIRKLTQTPPN